MKRLELSLCCLSAAALAVLPLFAQETSEEEETSPPAFEEPIEITLPVQLKGDQKDLRFEVEIHRWTDRGPQDEDGQRFTVSVAEEPVFMENIRWENGPEIEFEPGEHSKVVSFIFDTTPTGAASEATEEAQLLLRIEAHHEAVFPPERQLEIPLHFTRAPRPGNSVVSVCALRDDAPEDFPIEQAFGYCDPDRKPVIRSDRIVVFFTPARDLTEPIREDQYFYMRILDPNGEELLSRPFWNRGTEEAPEFSMPFTTEGSPGRFAVPLDLWRIHENPADGRTGPGVYTIQTVEARIEGNALFGQGEGTPFLASDDWQDEGTFEIGALYPAFAGFVAEKVDQLPLPAHAYPGKLTISEPRVSGTSVSIEMRASWRRRPDQPEQNAVSLLHLEFPEKLTPDYEDVGSFQAVFETLEGEEDLPLFFTAGVHHLVVTNRTPPDRYLVQGSAIPPLWERLEHTPSDCRGDKYWIWEQGESNPLLAAEPRTGSCTVVIAHGGGSLRSRFGSPLRQLSSHLHDKDAIWVIPVFYSLVNNDRPRSARRTVEVRSYGYAIYAAEPYTGPGPAGRPEAGEPAAEGEPDLISDTEAGAPARPGGEPQTSTTAGTGASPDTGIGPGPAPAAPGTEQPPAVDPSNPAGLNPNTQPQVASLVREWLTIAEPPENAVPGVRSRYDEFGRVIGGGPPTGRTIRTHDTVQYGPGATPAAKVWSTLRKKLDSIDHCTLEEYVVARLQNQSIEYCRGRYGAVRDLAGVPLAEARREVEAAGFQVTPAAGSPAPTPEASGTVERQEPGPAQYLRRGSMVTLVVHSPHIPDVLLTPDLVDLTRPEAKRRLRELGLESVLRAGTPASRPEESDLVEAQQPAAGNPVEPGEKVVLWVRSPFVAASTIPNVVGMSTSQAKAALASAGVSAESIDLMGGSPAPSPELAGKVEAQEPAPGWTVQSGTRIVLKVHSGFVELRTVPSVVGMHRAAATRSLAAAGLRMREVTGLPAPSRDVSGTVIEQSPAAGSTVSAGSMVQVTVHAEYVPPTPPPRVPPATPAPPRGNRVTGNPPLVCPASVMTTKQLGGPSGIPAGTRIPLVPARSGFDFSYKQYRVLFTCTYGRGGLTEILVRATWAPHEATLPYMGLCRKDYTNILGTRFLFGRGYQAMVGLLGRRLDPHEALRVGREFLRQLKDYSKPCRGTAPPRGRQPPAPPAPPKPPPAPQGCPGPQAPAVLWLHSIGPYGGAPVPVCRDRSGKMWINVSNNIHPVDRIQHGPATPDGKCWTGSSVVTPRHTYGGMLCR